VETEREAVSTRSEGLAGFLASAGGAGALLGLGIISATVFGVDAIRAGRGAGNLDTSFYRLAGGTFAGILAAGGLTWRLLAPVGSPYRRGALSIVCSFATILLMLVCIPVHQLWGRAGLLALLALSVALAALLSHRARRLGYQA
jgi:hypothetical protein